MSDFVHLHCHSEYSLLDGLPHPHDLAARAAELKQPALALTDHGSMFAAIGFYDACKANKIKPIIGVEAYLAKRRMKDKDAKEDRSSNHLLLLAENDEGYQNLLKLVSAAELEGFYYYPRVDHELLEKYSAGLIVTTGCPAGEVPRLLSEGRDADARKWFAWYRDVFKDRFYVELQEHGIAEFAGLDKKLIALAREFNVPLVATNDAHYLRPADAAAQDVLLCIQTNTVITDAKRMRMDGSDYYLKSSDEMRAVWREVPEAISNTLLVAERCNVDLSFKGYRLPIFPVPAGYTAEAYLRALCEDGFKKYYPNGNPIARERLDYELSVIHSMGFDTYFLIVWDLVRAAKEKSIWFNVRGSAAGSMAAYCAGITFLDPLEHRLIFERFLNPGRISMPDIDLDFQDDRRQELIEYTVLKYGRDNVAQIVTFGTLGAKAAIRDVGRALDYPLSEVDKVAKLVPNAPHTKLDDSLENVAELKQVYEENADIRKLIDRARTLEGVARHASTHAAGVVVTDKPVVEYVPLHRPTRGDEQTGFPVTQFDMNVLERVGLLKMDYLGLATLTIMRRACELIQQRHGIEFDLYNIPIQDPKAFELLSRGDVTGVFQVEGSGMRKVLTQIKPHKLEHIVATVSLYRPGPMENIGTYIRRLHGEERVEYKHPKLKTVLEETFGIIVYQEQIIQAAVALAGYKPGEADEIRKAVGKKIKEKIEAHREKFVKGAVNNGINKAVAESIYGDIEYFARYGFNKAHAVNYAVLTCQTAYLKAHYPIEYMAALLTTETGNIEKIGQLVNEARRSGIEILQPDVNTSAVDFTIASNNTSIHFALSAIKNIGVGAVEVIVNARNPSARFASGGGAFKSLDDFCRRVDLRLVNRRVLESLIKAGAMDRFGRRSQLLQVLDRMMSASQAAHQASERGQLSMFGSIAAAPDLSADTFGVLPDESEIPNRDKLQDEKDLTGAFFSDNPLMRLARSSHKNISHLANQIDESLAGQTITLAGVVTSARVITTKKGDAMAFVSVEDSTGAIEITVFPKTYARTRDLWQTESIAHVKGKVELRDGKVQILCESAQEYHIEEATESNEPPAPVQYAMADANEVAIADSAPIVEEARGEYDIDENVPPPEEPPDEFSAVNGRQSTVNSDRATVNSDRATVNSDRATVNSQQSTVNSVQPANGNNHTEKQNGKANGDGKPNGGNGGKANLAATATSTPRFQPPKHLRIFLQRTNDHDEDVRRMRKVLMLLSSVDGHDRFTFYVPNPQGVVQLDFPNHSTSYAQVQVSLDELMNDWGTLEIQ